MAELEDVMRMLVEMEQRQVQRVTDNFGKVHSRIDEVQTRQTETSTRMTNVEGQLFGQGTSPGIMDRMGKDLRDHAKTDEAMVREFRTSMGGLVEKIEKRFVDVEKDVSVVQRFVSRLKGIGVGLGILGGLTSAVILFILNYLWQQLWETIQVYHGG